MKPQLPIFVWTMLLAFLQVVSINIKNAGTDPLFSYKKKNRNFSRHQIKNHGHQEGIQYTPPQPQKRKLLLDWFDDDKKNEESKISGQGSGDMGKLVQMLKLAHTFDGDPNYEVQLSINYKNGSKYRGERKLKQVENNIKDGTGLFTL